MRTTLDLDDELMSELMKATQAKTKTEAIHLAMFDLIRRKNVGQLKALSGKVTLSYMRPAQRQAERRRQAKHHTLRNGHR